MSAEGFICDNLSVKAGRIRQTTPQRTRRRIRRGPERSAAYLAWIRTLRCSVCLRAPSEYYRIEAANTSVLGPRGLGQQSSDFSAIPLCFWHHQGNRDSYHRLGERLFACTHQVCLPELVLALNELYWEMTGGSRRKGVLQRTGQESTHSDGAFLGDETEGHVEAA